MFLGEKPVACVVAGVLLFVLWGARASSPTVTREPAPPVKAVLAAPAPAAVDPREIYPVFYKDEPTSIGELRLMERHIQAIIKEVSPTVVSVEVGSGVGSGVVISSDGLVLTAGHVCGRPNRDVVFTFYDGKTAKGKTLGLNENDDTGLMKITDPGPWPCARLGDLKHARLGDWTLALGNPGGFDLQRSLVVRLGRIIRLAPDIVQTDCTISPGDSGGPLFDMYGRVIAIHVAISTSMTENFHVPVSQFYGDWTELASGQRVKETSPPAMHAYCGAAVVDDPEGCRLTAVAENGPAARAGLKPGDVVLAVEGRKIQRSFNFERWIADSSPGDTLRVRVKRGDRTLTFDIKLVPPPEDE